MTALTENHKAHSKIVSPHLFIYLALLLNLIPPKLRLAKLPIYNKVEKQCLKVFGSASCLQKKVGETLGNKWIRES